MRKADNQLDRRHPVRINRRLMLDQLLDGAKAGGGAGAGRSVGAARRLLQQAPPRPRRPPRGGTATPQSLAAVEPGRGPDTPSNRAVLRSPPARPGRPGTARERCCSRGPGDRLQLRSTSRGRFRRRRCPRPFESSFRAASPPCRPRRASLNVVAAGQRPRGALHARRAGHLPAGTRSPGGRAALARARAVGREGRWIHEIVLVNQLFCRRRAGEATSRARADRHDATDPFWNKVWEAPR